LVFTETIDTELTHPKLLLLPKFISEHAAFGQLPGIKMSDVESYASSGGHYMEFWAGPTRGDFKGLVRVYLERPVKVELRSSTGRDETFEKQLVNVLLMILQFFEEEVRTSTLYLGFVPGSPKTAELRSGTSALRVMFSGNLLTLFLLSILIGTVVFFSLAAVGFERYAPIVLIALMLVLVLSVGRMATWRSPWRITPTSREVVIVQHSVPEGMLPQYLGEFRDRIRVAKERAYELFLSCRGEVCAESITDIFAQAGLPAKKEDFIVKRIDVYGMVERASKRFGMPPPAIVISGDPKPNAAATGFTKRLGTMIITMGLLVQLDEDEVEIVVGHELSHLRFGDPVVLFSLVMAEYLARVYLYGQYLGGFFFLYLLGVFWLIFFFGKFLETRADLEAGYIIGKPKVMAEALKKIGFRRLVLEERFLEPGGSRLSEWLRFDPHPPLYFRVRQMESLDLSKPPKHPFLTSVRSVLSGMAKSRNLP